MSNFPLPLAGEQISASGIVVSTPGASGVESAWVQVIASTSFTFSHMMLRIGPISIDTNNAVYLDIGVGAAGSEVPIVSDLYMPDATFFPGTYGNLMLAAMVPAGSRISVRSAAAAATLNGTYCVQILGMSSNAIASRGARRLERLATNALSTRLTSTAASVWTEIVASTAFASDGLVLSVGSTDQYGGSTLSIGVGAAGSEVAILTGFAPFLNTGGETMAHPVLVSIPVRVAAGVRVSIMFSAAVPANFSISGYRL